MNSRDRTHFLILLVTCFVASSLGSFCQSNPCMYGICMDESNSSYSCYCIDGYTGINCEINWDDCWSNPCLNGATCTDEVAAYNCTCTENYIGINCEERYNECLYTPCLNNGTCVDYNGFMCQCPEGYSGDFCEIDASVCNNTICKNYGECVEGRGLSFTCRCIDGWTGDLCEDDVNECITSPCRNGGLCLNVPGTYTCACLFGFTGKNCDKPVIPCDVNPCMNDAICLFEDNQSVCYCVPDFHGSLCELKYDECRSHHAVCSNGGSCIDGINSFTCSCRENYFGDHCTEYDPRMSATTEQVAESTSKLSPEIPLQSSTTVSTVLQSVNSTFTTEFYASMGSTTLKFDENQTFSGTSVFTGTQTQVPVETSSSRPDTVIEPHQLTTLTSEEFTTRHSTAQSLEDFTTRQTTTRSEDYTAYQSTIRSSEQSTSHQTTLMDSSISIAERESTTQGYDFGTSDQSLASTTETIQSTSLTYDDFSNYTSPIYIGVPTSHNVTMDVPIHTVTESGSILTSSAQLPGATVSTSNEFPPVQSSTIQNIVTTEKDGALNCTQHQCTYNTTCQSDSIECNCNYHEICNASREITNAAFNGKSYLRQQISIGDDGKLEIFIRVKTQSKNGIVLHAFFDDERYILLHMESGQLKFQFSCGLQTMLLGEIDSPINNAYSVDILTRFQYVNVRESDKCSAMLLLNNTVAMSGEQIVTKHDDIPRQVRLHLGGLPLTFSHYFPHIAVGFVGCMSFLKVNGIRRHLIRDSLDVYQIEECTSFLCLSNPCQNFGACHEKNGKVKCTCLPGYKGESCERSACDDNPCRYGSSCINSPGVGFICICPLGTHGLLCEEDISIMQASFSVFTPGISSYIAYGLVGSIKDNLEIKLRLMPRSLEQISLVAFLGQSGPYRDLSDHFAVTYVRGYLMLTWDLGSGARRIFTTTPLTAKIHRPHTLRVGRRGRDAWLSIDGLGNVTGRSAGAMTRLDVAPILYVGGHKMKNFETLPHDLPLHTGFDGCIYDIELRIDNKFFPIAKTSSATGRGVGECHRNECTHRSCKNGAVCLNHGPTYSCVCTKDWEGPDCSKPISL